jgi:hypothetical protein
MKNGSIFFDGNCSGKVLSITLFIYSNQTENELPEVIITHERVWIDECHEPFHTGDRQLKRINIRDAGR